jgi:hypothetical protein
LHQFLGFSTVPDLQRLIDEIRFRLQSQDCELTDELKQLAVDYVALCREVNGRLRRCGEHLKQGLRSEAIHLAESEPRLLDVVATADFPERNDWDEIVGIYQLPRPEPLLLDVAEQLNEAYALQQPLEKLLDRHRLLSLARAPLNQRMAVLRQLAKLDADSSVWEDDLRTLEKARAGEIEVEAEAASLKSDRQALQKLCDELNKGEWHQPPPATSIQKLARLSEETTRRSAREDLERLAVEWNTAFSALDLPQCRALRKRWNELAALARIGRADALFEQVGPALEWLADEDARVQDDQAFREATSELERNLADATNAVEELRRCGHAVMKFGRGIPEPLATRYHTRISALELATHRHHRLVVGSTVACVVLAVGTFGAIVYRNLQAGEVQRVADAAVQMIRDHRLAEARKLLESNSGMSSWEPWLAAQKHLLDAESQEQARTAALRVALEAIRNSMTFVQAEPHLTEARRLAQTPDEKLDIDRLEDKLKAEHLAATTANDKRFREQIENLAAQLSRLDRMHAEGDYGNSFTTLVRSVESGIAELNRLAASVSPGVASGAKLLESRLNAHKVNVSLAGKKSRLLDRLTKASSIHPGLPAADQNLSDYGETLQNYAEAFPSDARSKDFLAAAREIELWRGVIEWQRLIEPWNGARPRDLATTKRRAEACQHWLRNHPGSPTAAIAREYLEWLRSIVLRDEAESGDSDAGLRSRLMKLFSGSLIDGIYCVETNAGVRYYLPAEQKFTNNTTIRFSYLVGFAGETKSKTMPATNLRFDHAQVAPQSEMARTVRGKLPVVPFEGWNDYVRDLAESIWHDKHLDPFLRYFLLMRTLEFASKGNSLLMTELKSTLAKLHDDKVDLAAKWMDPDDTAARAVRQRAERVLATIGEKDILAAWERSSQREQRLAARMRDKLQIVGWLMRDPELGWICSSAWAARGVHQLQMAVPDRAGGVAEWTMIGNADPQRGLLIERAHAPDFKEGRAVFATDVQAHADHGS